MPAFVALLLVVFSWSRLVYLLTGRLVHVQHTEAVSLSLYGRWQSGPFITDAYSGQFPTIYNFLSDWLINGIAALTGLPPYHVQATIYVSLLVVGLFLASYLALRWIGIGWGAAFLAAVLVTGAGELPIAHLIRDPLHTWLGVQFLGNLIPPVASMGVGSAQVLGYVLFLPVLAVAFVATNRNGIVWPIVGGVLLGISGVVHTLTFLELGTTVSVYFAVNTVFVDAREGKSRSAFFRAGGLLALVVFVSELSRVQGPAMSHFALFWFGGFALSLRNRATFWTATFYGLSALVVVGPYLAQVLLLSVDAQLFSSEVTVVPTGEFVLFYGGQLLCLVLLLAGARRYPRPDILIWALTSLFVAIALGYGGVFGLRSHQYRFLTMAIFPFAVVTGMNLSLPRGTLKTIAVWAFIPMLLIGVARNFAMLAMPFSESVRQSLGPLVHYNAIQIVPPVEVEFLREVASETARMTDPNVLLPPEFAYPDQAFINGLVLAHSTKPAFIPDPRYITWHDMYADRVRVFCTLVPGYPQLDAHTGMRICDTTPTDLAPSRLTELHPILRTDVLGIYGIGLAPLLVSTYEPMISARFTELGMRMAFDNDGGRIWAPPAKPSRRLAFGEAGYNAPDFSIPFEAPVPGRYTVVMAGSGLAGKVTGAVVDGHALKLTPIGKDVLAVSLDAVSSKYVLSLGLAPDWRYNYVLPAPIRFIAGVPSESLVDAFAGPALADLPR